MSYRLRNLVPHQVGFTLQLENQLLLKEHSFSSAKALYGAVP